MGLCHAANKPFHIFLCFCDQRMLQAPERGPLASEGKDLCCAPLFVSATGGGSPRTAASPRTATSAGVWSLSLVCLDLEKDSRLKRESWEKEKDSNILTAESEYSSFYDFSSLFSSSEDRKNYCITTVITTFLYFGVLIRYLNFLRTSANTSRFQKGCRDTELRYLKT